MNSLDEVSIGTLSIAASSTARNFKHDFENLNSYHKTSAVDARDGPLKQIYLSCFVEQGACEKVGPIPVEWTWDQVVNLMLTYLFLTLCCFFSIFTSQKFEGTQCRVLE